MSKKNGEKKFNQINHNDIFYTLLKITMITYDHIFIENFTLLENVVNFITEQCPIYNHQNHLSENLNPLKKV